MSPSSTIHHWSRRREPSNGAPLKRSAKSRMTCPKCGRGYPENWMSRHLRVCSPIMPDPSRYIVPVIMPTPGHSRCACGRIKSLQEEKCCRCDGTAALVDWLVLQGRPASAVDELRRPGCEVAVAAEVR